MTGRERQLAAIRHELADRIAIDAICVENLQAVAAYLGIPAEQVLARLGIDGRIVAAPWTGRVKDPVQGIGFTEWGTMNTGDYGSGRAYPLQAVCSRRQVERYLWPDVGRYDFAAAGQAARELSRQYAVRGPYWMPLFCRVCDLMGMEGAMVQMLSAPVLFEAVLERVFVHALAYSRRLLDACGDALDIYCLGDDWATQRGLMIPPDKWRQFLKPRYAQLFDLAKRRGKFVWFHSCGDITAVLPDLIDIGVDVWETVQLHALPITPQALKRDFGKHLTFFGGVNTQRLPFATPAEVRREVGDCIRTLGKGGGYICGPDHHIKPDVSPANTVALFETAQAWRKNGYVRTG